MSQLTDDLVAGKYLSLGGGTINGSITLNNPTSNTLFEGAITLDAKSYGSESYSQIRFKNGSDVSTRYGFINLKGSTYGLGSGVEIGSRNNDSTTIWASIDASGITATSFIGNLTGNADSATKLSTSRKIWGQSFDGTGNVSGDMSGVGKIYANDGGYLTDINGGNIIVSIPTTTTGRWARGLIYKHLSNEDSFGSIGGVLGYGTTLTYFFYGGKYGESSHAMRLYDANQNYKAVFNGNVTAPKFIGALEGNVTGNASSATVATRLNTYTTSAAEHYPLLFRSYANADSTLSNAETHIYVNGKNNVYYIPSANTLHAPNINATTFTGNLIGDVSGNATSATSATKLATARTIWGQSFDGTGDISGDIKSDNIIPTDSGSYMLGTADNQWYAVYSTRLHSKAGSDLYIGASNNNNIVIKKGGNVAIGGTTASEKLDVNGNVKASGNMYATDFCTTSDNRLKDFTKDVIIDFNELKNIPKKYFYWKDKSMGEDLQLGTSAQELAKVYPECVSYNEKEDRYSVSYQKLSIIALAAIDKLHERISVLEKKLNDQNS